MSKSLLGWCAVIGAILTAYLAITSAVMWSDPPAAADLAVAKGLAVIAGALGFVSFVFGCAFAQASGLERDEAKRAEEAVRPT